MALAIHLALCIAPGARKVSLLQGRPGTIVGARGNPLLAADE